MAKNKGKYHDPKSYAAYMPIYGEFGSKSGGGQQWKEWGAKASNYRAMDTPLDPKRGNSQAAPVASRASATMRAKVDPSTEAPVQKPIPAGATWKAGTGKSRSHKEWALARTHAEKKSVASHTMRRYRNSEGSLPALPKPDMPEPKLPRIKKGKS